MPAIDTEEFPGIISVASWIRENFYRRDCEKSFIFMKMKYLLFAFSIASISGATFTEVGSQGIIRVGKLNVSTEVSASTGSLTIHFMEGFSMSFDGTSSRSISSVKAMPHGTFALGSSESLVVAVDPSDLSRKLEFPVKVSSLIESDSSNLVDIISLSDSSRGRWSSELIVLTNSSRIPITYYKPQSPVEFEESSISTGLIDVLEICPTSTKELISWCTSASRNVRIASIPAESGQSEGSILVLCDSSPAEENVMQGVACNPSTGDSWNFYIEKDSEYTFDDWVYCVDCEREQLVILSHNGSAYSVNAIHSSLLHVDGARVSSASGLSHGRPNLFSAPLPKQIPRSISVTRDTRDDNSLKAYISFSPDVTGNTDILVFQISFRGESGLDDDDDSSSTSLSIIVVITLIALGIAFPIYVNKHPRFKAKLLAFFTGKPEGSILLQPYEVSMELSPIGKETTENLPPLSLDAPVTGRRSSKGNALEVVIE